MADFIITGPDGKRYRVSGPDKAGAVKALHEGIKAGTVQPMKSVGARLWENIVGDNDPNTQNTGERIGTMLNMAGEAMTLGLVGDEASGAAAGVGAAIVPGGAGFSEAYANRRDFERTQQAIAEQEAPGMSLASKVAGALLPAALLKSPQTVMGALGFGAGAGGTTGFMEGEGGFANRAKAAAAGTVIGGALGAASIPIGKALSWALQKGGSALRGVFANRKFFNNGQLTEEGAQTLTALGYSLDDLDEAFKQEFQRGIREGLQPQESAAVATMREFNIPALRANVTGSADDFATMERAKRGALGPTLEAQVRGAMDTQFRAAQDAGEDIATRLAGGVKADAGQAAEAAVSSARASQEAARSAAGDAFKALENAGVGVQGIQLQGFGTRLGRMVQTSETPIRINPTTTPNASSAVDFVDDVFKGAEKGTVPFMEIERARQQLVRYSSAAKRSTGADQIAMDQMLSAFDAQVDDVMTRALTEGDPAVVEMAKNARSLWSKYKQQFLGDGAASKFIQKMIDEDASPDQVVNWLFGAGKLGSGGFNGTVAKGVKEVVSPEAWDMIRSAAFRKIIQKPEGMTQMGPQALVERIGDFFTNPATRDLSRSLFSAEEIATIMRYQMALKRMVPPPGSVNTSGTAYENARMLRNAWQAVAGLFGATTGGATGMLMAQGAASAAQRGSNWLTGQAIMSPTMPVTAGAAPYAAGAVGGALASPAADTATTLLAPPLPR